MRHVVGCITVAALILGAYWVGLGVGHKEAASSVSEPKAYEYADGQTYWCEIWEDGRTVIHTEQRYVTNDDDGNVVILTEVGR